MKNCITKSGFRFGLIGGIGFLVDGGIVTLLCAWHLTNVYIARIISFPVATVVTWYLNRSFTFQVQKRISTSKEEYMKYLIVQSGGSLLNLSVFTILLSFFSWMNEIPVFPLAIGAVFGMFFNYIFSRIWVFSEGVAK